MSFELFENDKTITNLVIIEPVIVTAAMYTTRYAVGYLCCGRHGTLSHRRIRERIAANTAMCKECARAAPRRQTVFLSYRKRIAEGILQSMKPGFHGWNPPPSAVQRKL